VAVYVTATAAGVRLLTAGARRAAAVAFAAVVVVLAFSGPYLAIPAAIALVGATIRRTRTRAPACQGVA
jgi:amino acid efflux transporter